MFLPKAAIAESLAPRELMPAPAKGYPWLVPLGLLVTIALLAGRIWWLPVKASLDPNEGWNAFHALEAMRGIGLYPSPDALTGNNYPPLSFYLVGALGELLGDQIVAGRIVSLVAIAGIACLIPACIRRLGARAEWAPATGVILFLGYNCIARGYVALDDPQWLGHFFMACGLWVLLRHYTGQEGSDGRIVLAALLTLAGALTKHNLIAFPIGTAWWLAMADRRAFGLWCAVLVLGLALSAALCWWLYGPNLFVGMFAAPRTYSLVGMLAKGTPYALLLLPAVLCARPILHGLAWSDPAALPLLIAAVAVPTGIVERSGAGVSYNAHFEAMIALSMLAPLGLDRLGGRRLTLGIALLLLPLLIELPRIVTDNLDELGSRQDTADAWADAIQRVRALPGPVACENQALCYWAGKGSQLDFFRSGQRLALGGDDRAVLAAIEGAKFSGVAIADDDDSGEFDSIVRLIDQRYRPIHDDGSIRLLVAR